MAALTTFMTKPDIAMANSTKTSFALWTTLRARSTQRRSWVRELAKAKGRALRAATTTGKTKHHFFLMWLFSLAELAGAGGLISLTP